jgi:iron complex outermembrane receptor protein
MASHDTKYKDGFTGTVGTLGGSNWRENGLNFRIDKDINKKQSLKVWFNYKESKDGYPISTPILRYWNEDDWYRIIFHATVGVRDENNVLVSTTKGQTGAVNPGYSNLFALDGAAYKSFSRFKANDWDFVYTFNKERGMDSFVRFYEQNHRRSHRDRYVWGHYNGINSNNQSTNYRNDFPDGATDAEFDAWIREHLAPFPDNKEAINEWVGKTGGVAAEPTSWRNEKSRGVQLQYAKSIGVLSVRQDIITSATYDNARNLNNSISNSTGELRTSYTERNTLRGFLQDKVHVTDKLEITPAIRYSWYSSFDTTNADGVNTKGRGKTNQITPVINLQYMFDDTLSTYGGWTSIFRPLRRSDYTTVDGVFKTPLEDEKGNAWTMGVRKDIGDTSIGVNYNWTIMSNAIASLPIWDSATDSSSRTSVNAREDRKALNITVDHRILDSLTVTASYSYTRNEWKAKEGWVLDPEWGYSNEADINLMINRLTPRNRYTLNVSYERDNFYTGILTNIYTGMDHIAFTSGRFLVFDWNMNYQIAKDTTVYLAISNLSNAAYQTTYYSRGGLGAAAMPGRCAVIGIKQKMNKDIIKDIFWR